VEKENYAMVEGYSVLKGRLLMDLQRQFAFSPARDGMLLTSTIIGQFHKIPFRKRSVKQWNAPVPHMH
jgi:hypothetical protein